MCVCARAYVCVFCFVVSVVLKGPKIPGDGRQEGQKETTDARARHHRNDFAMKWAAVKAIHSLCHARAQVCMCKW